jgi:hypothetical protein
MLQQMIDNTNTTLPVLNPGQPYEKVVNSNAHPNQTNIQAVIMPYRSNHAQTLFIVSSIDKSHNQNHHRYN